MRVIYLLVLCVTIVHIAEAVPCVSNSIISAISAGGDVNISCTQPLSIFIGGMILTNNVNIIGNEMVIFG